MGFLSYVINLPAKLGRTTSAGSVSVTLSSDDAAVAALNAIEASVAAPSLPSGASTSANQTTANTALSAIETSVAASATAANQTTANTSLATIAAAQGAGGTSISEPAGGSGLLGWLSGIYKSLTGTLTVTPSAATLTDHSGTITTGGTAQILMAANATRKGWRLQNTSAGDLWFKDVGSTGTDASSGGMGCFKVASGGYYETPSGGSSQGVISIFGATTAQSLSASEW
ncbi:cytoskeletal protein RodZ [Paraburkholderia sp. WC7.3g]|uniref:hypothetical protein n=1 Tax=Paraburkholderia sp. WC7.3g TaxID=2991070 RepID=UPI003D1BBD0A